MRFDEILRNDALLDGLDDMNFQECTPIQELGMPPVLAGRDLLAVAQTGTGKTAAYLLPIIECLVEDGYPTDCVNCVVMAPTRELAQQIDQQMEGFSYFVPVTSAPIYGGTDGEGYERQRKSLKAGADVVIATPGRLLAHLSMGYVDLSKVSFFVLDEADRMLDMGFMDDIMQIVGRLPKKRQTLLFSATMPPKIQALAKNLLHNPVFIELAVSKPADKIKQSAYICYEPQKLPILKSIFVRERFGKVIIFSSSKLKVKELAKVLRSIKMNVAEMHSDLSQAVREEVMLKFKAGKVNIIVATDILARGIDIDDIELVINYDVPREAEDYVHRIGRTARANKDGRAITFVNEKEIGRLKIIERLLEKEIPKEEVDKILGETPSYTSSRNKRVRHSKNYTKQRLKVTSKTQVSAKEDETVMPVKVKSHRRSHRSYKEGEKNK
ncbi:MAG: DEAD/DEAH box helicase [Muribaculaceae bacterium]|nr:DEAD/DEAH box helicase [Muribaculaceae bacterium]